MTKPELLAPAGGWDCLVAAVQSGADAVYLGGKTLNARRGAANFDAEELVRASDYLHERGKKLYVTVNTLLKECEMGELEDTAEQLYRARPDGVIVQDMGVCGFFRQVLPDLRLHASTQMAISNPQGALYLKQKGFKRAVLAREMLLEEISACADTGIEVEVFCHGALCVAYSGLCLFSGMVGGRSGNRGACAQPCRMEYEAGGSASAKGFLLSPKDLMAAPLLEKLVRAGVSSLKIEGRLKKPEYVAVVTSAYRRLLDGEELSEKLVDELKQVFNRGGFTQGYFEGIKDGEFLSTIRPGHQGVAVGKAERRSILLSRDVDRGDSLAVRNENGEDIPIKLSGKAGERVPNPAKTGGSVYRMQSKALLDAVSERLRRERGCVELSARLLIETGKPALLTLDDGVNRVEVRGEQVLPSPNGGMNAERLESQLKKTGGTPYTLVRTNVEADANAYISMSAVNSLRRQALERIAQERIQAARGNWTKRAYAAAVDARHEPQLSPRIFVQADDTMLLRRLLAEGADEAVYFPSDLRSDALEKVETEGMFLYLPPVMAGKTLDKLNRFAIDRASGLKGVYISNPGQLALDWPGEKRFDFSMNIANNAALAFLGAGECVYTPSIELTSREIRQIEGSRELVVYGRVPLMHLRHCPLNAIRGGGLHRECRACDKARYGKRLSELGFTDRTGARFPFRRLAADEGCVIDLLNSVPLDLLSRAGELPESCAWRLLFSDEDETTAIRLTGAFREAASGRLIQNNFSEKYTTGHYFRITE
ncbi:MAG: U32 family peptidase [Clostridiales bacterium]|nr:U32 family peptidase [Clostridiales bacterium]